MVCKTIQHLGLATRLIVFWGSLRCPTRNEGASRAGRYLEGPGVFAVRFRNR